MLVPRVMELVCWMKTFMATRIASVAMPAATPTSRTIGMPNTIATTSAATPPASVPSSAFNWVGKTRSLSKCGIERNVNCLIAVGIVSSADVYAPTATNATCPNERIPELPLNICSASTISRRRKYFSASSL